MDPEIALPRFEAYLGLARLFEALPALADAPIDEAFIDLADFGKWNGAHGEKAGDDLLTEVARHLRAVPHARAIRVGGDEFLLVGTPEDAGLEDAMRVLAARWPELSRARFPDLPVVPLRAAVASGRAGGLREGYEKLGVHIGDLKHEHPDRAPRASSSATPDRSCGVAVRSTSYPASNGGSYGRRRLEVSMDRSLEVRLGGVDAPDEPVRRLLEQIAAPAALAVPDLPAIGAALADLAADLDYVARWADRLGDRNGLFPIHAPIRGPRLIIVHRRAGQMSAVHDHGTWVALSPISGLETHRRYRLTDGPEYRPVLAEVTSLRPAQVATLLPPDDVHDHGHLGGHGTPAHVLVLTGDDQSRFERNEWDPVTGRHRVLPAGDLGRWLASDPWP